MSAPSDDLPTIAALFVSGFHKREGYKLLWQASDVNLDACEYKTLPSGLEKIPEDVIFFTQGACIGLAAYRNIQLSGAEREEYSCISVAVLVSSEGHNLRHQRLNKIWLFNSLLRELANAIDPKVADYTMLEKTYAIYKGTPVRKHPVIASQAKSPPASPVLSRNSSFKNYQSFRTDRDTTRANDTSLLPAHELSNLHPVLSLHDCISLFGPLIFPVFRAALARKRILVMTEAPVQRACHFIYNIQLISAIPNNAPTMKKPSPLRQLFCLGINDIPYLDQLQNDESGRSGWIGVTTDRLFETKTELWDLLIRLPPESTTQSLSRDRTRPTLTSGPDGLVIRPSYLDALNFTKLKPFLPIYRDTGLTARPQPSWKRSTLDSFLSTLWYWASAGQSLQIAEDNSHLEESTMTLNEDEEDELDENSPLVTTGRASKTHVPSHNNGRDEVIVLVLFHRLTTSIMQLLDELTSESLEEIRISRDQMVRIGLTPRLASDVALIEELGRYWFARDVIVDKSFWPCC